MTAPRRRGLLVDDPIATRIDHPARRHSNADATNDARLRNIPLEQTRSSPASGSTTQACSRSHTRSASAAYSSQ
jgi:hypothetical protein